MILPETEVKYVPGQSFKCFKRPLIPVGSELVVGPECGAEIVMHGYWWCAQVCPSCLANYYTTRGLGPVCVGLDTSGFYPADTAAHVRQTIAANNGQYVPQF